MSKLTGWSAIPATALAVACIVLVPGCGNDTKVVTRSDIQQNMASSGYVLTSAEIERATINAKRYFERPYSYARDGGETQTETGSFQECRPTDSNSNGLVTCMGQHRNTAGKFVTGVRYCGYMEGARAIQSCSDVDVVVK